MGLFKYSYYLTKDFGFRVGMTSSLAGICSRIKLDKAYRYLSKKRFEACQDYIRGNYADVIDRYKELDRAGKLNLNESIGEDSPIWTYWHQGVENAPFPVKECLESKRVHTDGRLYKVLTYDDVKDYVDVPEHITSKLEEGKMSLAHYSDWLRTALLDKYGGIWIDSTFFQKKELPRSVGTCAFYTINWGGDATG